MVWYITYCPSFIYSFHRQKALAISIFFQATDDVAEGIIEEDYALFYEIWQEFDPEATMYISYDHVPELLDVLEPPLQVKGGIFFQK